ncbi:MAG: cohesin domain-containing protein [Candidatus Saccharimonadales bacterium]
MSRFARRLQQSTAVSTSVIKLYLTPSQGAHIVGDTVVVTIREDSLTTPVNSVGVDLTYPAGMLQYQSSSTTGSGFTTTIQNTGGSGAVNIAVGILAGSVTGDQLVGTVTFLVIGTGQADVTFDPTSGIARAAPPNDDVCQAKLNASYTIS